MGSARTPFLDQHGKEPGRGIADIDGLFPQKGGERGGVSLGFVADGDQCVTLEQGGEDLFHRGVEDQRCRHGHGQGTLVVPVNFPAQIVHQVDHRLVLDNHAFRPAR